jgi:3-hydroxyacyl-[acyl-carrier-protein] dehydratase
MAPPLIIDMEQVDLDRVELTRDQIYQILPHRHEFMLLDGVCLADAQTMHLVAYADIRSDAWWTRGHVPGRPLLPGVLMLEMAGHASAILGRVLAGHEGFLGFGGVEACKFREAVVPPGRLYLLCVGEEFRRRRIISRTQGVIGDRLIFEARITGLLLG